MSHEKPVVNSTAAVEPDVLIRQLRAENIALRRELAELGLFRHLALCDPLTGLHNRRSFDECLRREWSRWRRCAVPFALLVIDLDDFKAVNDSFGHAVGDGVLRWFAGALLDACRELDVVCRTGGDEFVVLLPATTTRGAEQVGVRLAGAVAQSPGAPQLPGRRGVRFSWGCSSTEQAASPGEMLQLADAAMYAGKRQARHPGIAACMPMLAQPVDWPDAPLPANALLCGPPPGGPSDGGDGPPAVA